MYRMALAMLLTVSSGLCGVAFTASCYFLPAFHDPLMMHHAETMDGDHLSHARHAHHAGAWQPIIQELLEQPGDISM